MQDWPCIWLANTLLFIARACLCREDLTIYLKNGTEGAAGGGSTPHTFQLTPRSRVVSPPKLQPPSGHPKDPQPHQIPKDRDESHVLLRIGSILMICHSHRYR
ncbi:hypothetical protein SUGI_0364190 [Cryptomeria japonica]|nr:hypothetical protein SUGI_0364190 [Cryptomeria japonica]